MEVPERAFSSAPKEVPEREALLGSRTFGRPAHTILDASE